MNARLSVGVAVCVSTRDNTQVTQPAPRGTGRDPEKVANWTKARSLRVPDEEWLPARERVEEQGETLTEPIRELIRFLGTGDPKAMRALLRKYSKQ